MSRRVGVTELQSTEGSPGVPLRRQNLVVRHHPPADGKPLPFCVGSLRIGENFRHRQPAGQLNDAVRRPVAKWRAWERGICWRRGQRCRSGRWHWQRWLRWMLGPTGRRWGRQGLRGRGRGTRQKGIQVCQFWQRNCGYRHGRGGAPCRPQVSSQQPPQPLVVLWQMMMRGVDRAERPECRTSRPQQGQRGQWQRGLLLLQQGQLLDLQALQRP